MKKSKKKKIKKLISKIDKFFDDQRATPTSREYANFIADLHHELSQMIKDK